LKEQFFFEDTTHNWSTVLEKKEVFETKGTLPKAC